MTLRCRPGDLAMVVNDIEEPKNNGALVQVIERADRSFYDIPVDWECRAVSAIKFCGSVHPPGTDGFGYRDRELRPLRDPGDDAVDEILRPLPNEVTA